MCIGRRSARRSLVCPTLACALAASLLAACGSGGTGRGDHGVERYTLGNGLTVILLEDDRLPIVAVNLSYRVSPANEAARRTGLAHLFEHMMGKGSGHIPDGEAEKLLDAAGATGVNATTGFDRTNFFETVPSNALEIALWQESDRMGFLLDALGQAKLSTEQSVVRNERRQTTEAATLGLTLEAVYRGCSTRATRTTPPSSVRTPTSRPRGWRRCGSSSGATTCPTMPAWPSSGTSTCPRPRR